MHEMDTTTNVEDIAHDASNEAMSITIGVEVLASLPESVLSPTQSRALKNLQDSSGRLLDLIDAMKAELRSQTS